jgi:diguanylate cyclase (GGDEF)-like protein
VTSVEGNSGWKTGAGPNRLVGLYQSLFQRQMPDQVLHFELVRALYSTPKSILAAGVVASAMVELAAWLSGDPVYRAFLISFLVIGTARPLAVMAFRRSDTDPSDARAVRLWELSALLGAWFFAGLIGLVGAYTLLFHSGGDIEILISCGVIGYIAGISSRNASRPIITIGQISLTCIPFILALLWRFDLTHLALASFLGALYVSTTVMCQVAFDNIIARHSAYTKIESLAQRDSLTGLLNRPAFFRSLSGHLEAIGNSPNIVALIAIDLDRFKDINDTLGHPAGDAVLRETAERVLSCVRPDDEVARIGGDEFLVMMSGILPSDLESAARRIVGRLSEPFKVDQVLCNCGASVGYAVAPHDGLQLDTLIRNADLALYEAKKQGRGQIVAYTPAHAEEYERRIALEQDLRLALAEGQFELVYQPIVDSRSGRTLCCEALLRWHHPVHGLVSPSIFVPIAESMGLIVPIANWVIRSACREATGWRDDVKVAINLSPIHFKRGRDIVHSVTQALIETGLPAERLDLEVTEMVLIEDSAVALETLEEFRSRQIGVTLDDFGIGFASLAYLNDFPFSKVKIDKKFSQTIAKSARTAAIVKGVAHTTRELNMELVAEGIETEEQLACMRKLGVYTIQGFLFSKPVSASDLKALIEAPLLPKRAPIARISDHIELRKSARSLAN